MVIVEPIVSEERLRQLLDEQAESGPLDYKSRCDLREKANLVELAKDIGAFQIDGGYVVVGADNQGRPSHEVTWDHSALFDEATLRAKLRKWLPEPLELLAGAHEINGDLFVLIYVGPSLDGFAVFQADGQSVKTAGKEVTAFRRGDVFARHGSASEPWSQSDIRRVIDRLVAARKEEWRRSLATDFARLEAGTEGRRIASMTATALTWNLDAESFEAALVELLRTQDEIPVQMLLERLPAEAFELTRESVRLPDLETLVDRLACLGGLALRLGRADLVELTVDTMVRVYDLGFAIEREAGDPPITAPTLWLMILERVVALGALAVRKERWGAVRSLALRRGSADGWRHESSSWVRHGLTMAARSGLFTEKQDGRDVERSLLSLAQRAIERNACLRADLPSGDERLLNSLCQFDALACLAVVAHAGRASRSDFYPSFARFYGHRTEPAFVRVIHDPVVREAICPLSDDELASAMRAIDEVARRASFLFSGWDGFTDERVLRFLDQHPVLHE